MTGFHSLSFQVGQAGAGRAGMLAPAQLVRNARLQAGCALLGPAKTQAEE